MSDALRDARPWLAFTGGALVVGILSWAQAVIVPVSVAVLMTFLLAPVVSWLERGIGRMPAVLAVVVLAFAALGLTGWVVAQQLGNLAAELPTYQQNIRQKIRDVRGASAGDSVEKIQKTVENIQAEIGAGEPPAARARPLIVSTERIDSLWGFPGAIAPLLAPLATAGLIVALVVFMLLEREDLRNRCIRLFGHQRLVVTTRAFDEAGRRVSRYLLVQSLVNLAFGVGVGVGLSVIGVPYALLWGALAGALRFIPYVGPIIAGLAPVLVALAALEGWARPLSVVALFVVLELFTNLVLETVVYAGAAGVSQVALLVAVAFWSWLWGPLGLLMATPLTVCLAVLGKYVPGLEFFATLMSDEPVLAPDVAYYQRLLAGDQAEASEILEQHVGEQPPESVYDAILLPALTYAERDRLEGRLSAQEERAVVDATRELLADAPRPPSPAPAANGEPEIPIPVLGVAAHGAPDALALAMLDGLLDGTPIALEVHAEAALSSEVLDTARAGSYRAVCIADLPPSPPSRSRYLLKRLRTLAPDLPVIIGRWAPPELADENTEALLAAGAAHVGTSLLDSRDYLLQSIAKMSLPPADAEG